MLGYIFLSEDFITFINSVDTDSTFDCKSTHLEVSPNTKGYIFAACSYLVGLKVWLFVRVYFVNESIDV